MSFFYLIGANVESYFYSQLFNLKPKNMILSIIIWEKNKKKTQESKSWGVTNKIFLT